MDTVNSFTESRNNQVIVKGFKPFFGEHCETTMLGNLLKHVGSEINEPMLFGLGEGIGYIHWDHSQMDAPFLGGRSKIDTISKKLSSNLQINIQTAETTSKVKAWESVKHFIDRDIPVGIKLDCYYLDYFTTKYHFAGHYVTLFGHDDRNAYVVDTGQQGSVHTTNLGNFQEGRAAKGPMSSKNKLFVITEPPLVKDHSTVTIKAIKNNCKNYLSPPIKNFSHLGILKTAETITSWASRFSNNLHLLHRVGIIIDKGGTGGGLFRKMYGDFLGECSELLSSSDLLKYKEIFHGIANQWSEVSSLICRSADTASVKPLEDAAIILRKISSYEKQAFTSLYSLTDSVGFSK